MVLVAERTEQACQGNTGVPPADDDGPTIMETADYLVARGPAGPGPQPSGEPEVLGATGPATQEPSVVTEGKTNPVARVRTIQKPVYYISEVLHEAKARYLEMHKLIYAIIIASRKLRHYFQAHRVVVVTSYPLRAILHNSNATGNIAKWAAGLAEFQLDFQPHHAVKSQILADFIAEWTPSPSNPGGPDPNAGPPEPEAETLVFTKPH